MALAGGLLAFPVDAHRNNTPIMVRSWSAGRPGPARIVARERGIKRVEVGSIAAAELPAGDVVVVWERQEMEGVEAPIRLRGLRVALTGQPLGEPFDVARIGSFGDYEDSEGDSVFVNLDIETANSGVVLAGWQTPGTRKRFEDRVGVVRRLSHSGRPIGRLHSVTDAGADDFALAAAGNQFIATWTRFRAGGIETRARVLDSDGSPLAAAVTLRTVRPPADGWWATPVYAATATEVMELTARRASAGITVYAQRRDLELQPRGERVSLGRIDLNDTTGASLKVASGPDGGWLAAAAALRPETGDFTFPPSPIFAGRVGPTGEVDPIRQVAANGTSLGVEFVWDREHRWLAWTSASSDSSFAHLRATKPF